LTIPIPIPNPPLLVGPKLDTLGVCIPGFETRVIVDGVLGPFSSIVVVVGEGGNTNKVCEGVINPVVVVTIPAPISPSPGVVLPEIDSEERRRRLLLLPLPMLDDIEVEDDEEEDNDEDNRTFCRSEEDARVVFDSERLRIGVGMGMGLGVGGGWKLAGIDFAVGIDVVDIDVDEAGNVIVDCKLSLLTAATPAPGSSRFSVTSATGDAGTGGRPLRLKLKLAGLRFAFGLVREGAGEGDGERPGGRSNVGRMAVAGTG